MLRNLLVIGGLAVFAVSSGSADDIAVTVYNSNLGVVSETRSLDFAKGINQLAFRDVPSQIDPNSVRFELLEGDGVGILEQNYAFDLVSPDQIMKKYIDSRVSLVDEDGNLYEGTLLAAVGGAVTLRDADGQIRIVRMDKIAETRFPELPEGLITRPTLFWQYNSDFSGSREARVGYQTTGLSWSAEYVGVLNEEDTQLDLSGWAAINNTSGKAYADATLKLIAGDIHRAQRGRQPREMEMFSAKADMAAGFDQKAFFEYHMYTLPRQTTLANNQIKQISLFEPAATGVEKFYLYEPEKNNKQVTVAVKFTNSEKAGLGMPLPEGRVRLFKSDAADGSLILLGEDMIDHTPKNEEIKLSVGYAFDIVAEEVVKDSKRVAKDIEDRTFEISLRNRKEESVTVSVEKKLWGYWEVVDAGFEYEKKDASTLTFDLTIPADTELTVTYTVRFTSH